MPIAAAEPGVPGSQVSMLSPGTELPSSGLNPGMRLGQKSR
jgi:hypothetical protein